jgi:PhnB protein
MTDTACTISIQPWLSVRDGARAVEFYKAAFGATEEYRLDGNDDTIVVARLSFGGAEFWLSEESPEHPAHSPETFGGGTIRIIVTVPDPDAAFSRAVTAGATAIYPVSEGHGWRVGRIADPFGHHWEIGRPLDT